MNNLHPEPYTTRLVLRMADDCLLGRGSLPSHLPSHPKGSASPVGLASHVKMLLIDLPTWIWLVWGRCWQTSGKLLDIFREHVIVHGFLHIKCWVFPLCFTIFSPKAWQGLGSPGWPGWDLHRINSYGPKKGLYLLWVQLPTAKLMFFVF